jgi:peroxiredoxin
MKAFKSLFLLLFPLISAAQNVTIKGLAKSYENRQVGLWVYNDRISNTQKLLSSAKIDSAGNFLLEFNIKAIDYVNLKIDKNVTAMFVEPGRNYEVIIHPPDSTAYQNPNIEHDVKIEIRLTSKTEINSLTIDYEKRFDDFLAVNYSDFLKRSPQPALDSFKRAMQEFYSTVSNTYFNNYINYSIASMQRNTKMSEKKLYETYLQNKPILYDHPEYMAFFNAFYKDKLSSFALAKAGNDVHFIIDDRGSFPALVSALKRISFVANDTIAELVMLKGLYESYYDGTFKKTGIKAILQQTVTDSKIGEHQKIAQNILNSFSPLQKGSAAPPFVLPDRTGATHTLEEIRDKKIVYVMFFDRNNSASQEQMKLIPALKKTYGERISFVSISADRSNASLNDFQQKNPKYDWLFLYDNSNGELKNSYEIVALPSYFLIGPDGKFIQVPADSPEGDIEQIFYDLTKLKSKLHGVGNKQNQK